MIISIFSGKGGHRGFDTRFAALVKKPEGKVGWVSVVMLAGLIIFSSFNPLAAAEGSSITTSQVDIEPVIVVEAASSTISTSQTGMGEIEITANFSVEANTKQVNMYVEATASYFNGDPAASEVSPIPLLESSGVEIDAGGAVVLSGNNPASFADNGDPIEGYPSRKTETLTFESNDLVFNHQTDITVTWDQADPLKPAGQYYAKIKLTCLTVSP